uniref:Uncharacterized protein n=1 Tax=viral metagenome TaxID=1070528 RepID=A0A6H1ZHZ7_9ZZZZ
MLKRGDVDVKWNGDKEDDEHWFEKVNFHELGIPFARRPKGGKRYSFSGFDFEYTIAEIKEQSYGRFKSNIDVNRNAHFIGMNILHQMYVKNKKSGLEEKLSNKLKQSKKTLYVQETLCDFFKEFYESYAKGMMTLDELMDRAIDISEEVYDEKIKEWFLEYCSEMVNDKDTFRRTKDKIRKKKAYSAGIEVVGEM